MNFDELQNKWNQQTGNAVNIRTESLKKTRSITDKISRNFKREFVFSALSFLFLFTIPIYDSFSIEIKMLHYFFLLQMLIPYLFYYRRFLAFNKMTKKDDVFSSKENLIQLYYELKFAVESYKISCYIIVPSALGLYFVIFGKNRTFEWFMKYVNFRETLAIDPNFIWKTSIIGILLLAFVLLFCEWTIDKYYGKYLKQIKLLLKNLEE
ncbi:hypothetical protein FAZ15_22260 [Sphingobacterium olei]|uniref:Uncharacterized protein n=1 Tax=Sphingobacterium olei TaxID=2571155 RepID=A0A4U0N7A8_9SPHI|nr:hypothetical protein [Sphingobacterium olei]TJZ49423.1 hypothetical protein FAZ15_22260 [Sphingobacterium olei]